MDDYNKQKKVYKKVVSPIAFDKIKPEPEVIEDKKYRLKSSILNVVIATIIGFNIPSAKQHEGLWPVVLISAALIFNFTRMIYFWKRCPKCKKRNSMRPLKKENSDFIDSSNPWSDTIYFNETTIEKCEACQHKIKTKISKSKDIPGHANYKIDKIIKEKH